MPTYAKPLCPWCLHWAFARPPACWQQDAWQPLEQQAQRWVAGLHSHWKLHAALCGLCPGEPTNWPLAASDEDLSMSRAATLVSQHAIHRSHQSRWTMSYLHPTLPSTAQSAQKVACSAAARQVEECEELRPRRSSA